jgi:general secretion pathway protein D
VRITADSVNNTLLIYASQEQYRTIEQTIKEVDQPQLQVAIDATIAEVTLTDDLQYGVQSYIMSRDLGLKPDIGSFGYSAAFAVVAAAADVALQRAIPGFSFLVGNASTHSRYLRSRVWQTDKQIKRTELIIFIRPQIIRDGADAHYVAEELRTKLRGTINAIGPKQTGPTTYR